MRTIGALLLNVVLPLCVLFILWPPVIRASQEEAGRDPLAEAIDALVTVLTSDDDEGDAAGGAPAAAGAEVDNDLGAAIDELETVDAELDSVQRDLDVGLDTGQPDRSLVDRVEADLDGVSESIRAARTRAESAQEDLRAGEADVAATELGEAIETVSAMADETQGRTEVTYPWFLGTRSALLDTETLLLVLATVAGVVGGGLRSLIDFSEADPGRGLEFKGLSPFLGGAVAVVIYFILRGGLLNVSSAGVNLNPFTIVAISTISGLYFDRIVRALQRLIPHLVGPTGSPRAGGGGGAGAARTPVE